MIVITVKYEADKPDLIPRTPDVAKALAMSAAIAVWMTQTATGNAFTSVLRPGESVEHRLRVVPSERLEIKIEGAV